MNHPFETGLKVAVRWIVAASALSTGAFLITAADHNQQLWVVGVHLSLLTIGVFALTHRLAPVFDSGAFAHLSPFSRRLATDAALVALVTGATALITLASSATLRYQPSLQFLQLLSALDIAWTTSGFYLGVRRISSKSWAGPVAGGFMGLMCVFSLVRYLAIIGFAADGGWDVQGPEMLRLVIPADTLAAVLTIGALLIGARRHASTSAVHSAP